LAAAHATIAELRGWVGQLRGAETAALEAELRQLRAAAEQSRNEYSALGASHQQLTAEIEACRSQLVETRELALLQEVGVYEYAHPLDDALAYKDALNALKQQIKAAARATR
jgi:chromosome segregation ATPase